METKELGGKQVEVDEDGFIQDPDVWDEAVAASLAETEGVADMTDDHWKVVNYIREYYLEYKMAPMIRRFSASGVSMPNPSIGWATWSRR